jgi:hypothetical protein
VRRLHPGRREGGHCDGWNCFLCLKND